MLRTNQWLCILAVVAVPWLAGCLAKPLPSRPRLAYLETKTLSELKDERERLRTVLLESTDLSHGVLPTDRQMECMAKAALIGDVVALAYLDKSLSPEAPSKRLDKFELPDDPVRLTVIQRTSKAIPGFAGTVEVHIMDITGRQVLMEITPVCPLLSSMDLWAGRARALPPLADTASVEVGDVTEFALAGRTYYVTLIKLRNFLSGDDFAVFEISTKRPTDERLEELRRPARPQARQDP